MAKEKFRKVQELVETARNSAWQSVLEIAKYVKELERGSKH